MCHMYHWLWSSVLYQLNRYGFSPGSPEKKVVCAAVDNCWRMYPHSPTWIFVFPKEIKVIPGNCCNVQEPEWDLLVCWILRDIWRSLMAWNVGTMAFSLKCCKRGPSRVALVPASSFHAYCREQHSDFIICGGDRTTPQSEICLLSVLEGEMSWWTSTDKKWTSDWERLRNRSPFNAWRTTYCKYNTA